jgi:hypothetical protein
VATVEEMKAKCEPQANGEEFPGQQSSEQSSCVEYVVLDKVEATGETVQVKVKCEVVVGVAGKGRIVDTCC